LLFYLIFKTYSYICSCEICYTCTMNQYKRICLFLIFLFQSYLSCFCQIIYSEGYFVDNKNIKTECMIKNYDWLTSPVKIQYRLPGNTDVLTVKIDSIKEFGINNFSHYVRSTVNIDRSPFELKLLSDNKKPQWSEETLFLKELVCGKAVLWMYTEPEQCWFFYSKDNSVPEQLLYKEYLVDGKIAENNFYRQQLVAYLRNDYTKNVNVNSVKYNESALVKYFNEYNSTYQYCQRIDLNKPKREVLNIKLTGSVNYSSLTVGNSSIYEGVCVYDYKFNWMGGIEAEYFLPFNRNTWSLLIAPTYESIFDSKVIQGDARTVKMQTIHFPIGGRYTKYFKNGVRCFLNMYFNSMYCLRFNDNFHYSKGINKKIAEGNNFIFGGGAAYKNWGLELRYHTSRDLLADYSLWFTKYPKVSLTASYKFISIQGQ
jgi:hypothetical protein